MLGEPWFYWLMLALAVALWVAIPLAAAWERRQEAKDAELWARQFGGDIYSRRVD